MEVNDHKKVFIKNVKLDQVFRLKVNGPVYVRSNYDLPQKKYEAYKWDDINHFIYKRGDFPVFINFEF